MEGPYFDGQIPADCGHYYPDVLSEVDVKTRDGEYIRVLNCKYCGRYEISLDAEKCSRVIDELNKKFFRPHFDSRKIAEIREEELKRITS